jgi:hypothetical protein
MQTATAARSDIFFIGGSLIKDAAIMPLPSMHGNGDAANRAAGAVSRLAASAGGAPGGLSLSSL